MRKSKKHILLYFTFASIAALIVYNIFGFAIHSSEVISVNPIFILPFALLLLSIAVMPFLNRAWWDRYYPYVALAFGSIVIVYYFFGLQHADRIVATSYDYICFMSLIGSLYIVSSSIHINFRGKTTPAGNVALLTMGSVLSNFIGTTGASMLLIRPFLRMNRYRIKPYHIVFFIFLVSNIGGAMTPIGNPPLFFGYLKGIPFFWMADHSASLWLLSMGILLTIFFVIDRIAFHKESKTVRSEAAMIDDSEVHGLHNIIFLLIIVGAVFIDSPAPLLLREVIMWGAALASYFTTKPEAHQKNNFNFIPLKEVAILFAGIFAAMMPALDWLETHAAGMGIVTPGQYYWYSGTLSSILDNAPTYLNFLTAAFGLHGANVNTVDHVKMMLGTIPPSASGIGNTLHTGLLSITPDSWKYIQAVSVGSVFFGAATYIGNGPNFMVKSIAEQMNIECPHFFSYILKYSLPVLVPLYVLLWICWFH